VPVLGWCAATATSVALASVALLPVLRTATPAESAPISVDQLSGSDVVLPSPPPRSTPDRATGPRATNSPARIRSARPSGSPERTSPAPPPRRTTAPPAATTVEDGWTVTTEADGSKSYLRSFHVEGGQTVIRITDGAVHLVTATPSDGYSVATVQNSPENLAVYFNEVNHSFIIHAVWNVDRPFAEVSEVGQ
jgi:hypothetical protein